jgi:hypothetical protein
MITFMTAACATGVNNKTDAAIQRGFTAADAATLATKTTNVPALNAVRAATGVLALIGFGTKNRYSNDGNNERFIYTIDGSVAKMAFI